MRALAATSAGPFADQSIDVAPEEMIVQASVDVGFRLAARA
jgi:hypothetical protein